MEEVSGKKERAESVRVLFQLKLFKNIFNSS